MMRRGIRSPPIGRAHDCSRPPRMNNKRSEDGGTADQREIGTDGGVGQKSARRWIRMNEVFLL